MAKDTSQSPSSLPSSLRPHLKVPFAASPLPSTSSSNPGTPSSVPQVPSRSGLPLTEFTARHSANHLLPGSRHSHRATEFEEGLIVLPPLNPPSPEGRSNVSIASFEAVAAQAQAAPVPGSGSLVPPPRLQTQPPSSLSQSAPRPVLGKSPLETLANIGSAERGGNSGSRVNVPPHLTSHNQSLVPVSAVSSPSGRYDHSAPLPPRTPSSASASEVSPAVDVKELASEEGDERRSRAWEKSRKSSDSESGEDGSEYEYEEDDDDDYEEEDYRGSKERDVHMRYSDSRTSTERGRRDIPPQDSAQRGIPSYVKAYSTPPTSSSYPGSGVGSTLYPGSSYPSTSQSGQYIPHAGTQTQPPHSYSHSRLVHNPALSERYAQFPPRESQAIYEHQQTYPYHPPYAPSPNYPYGHGRGQHGVPNSYGRHHTRPIDIPGPSSSSSRNAWMEPDPHAPTAPRSRSNPHSRPRTPPHPPAPLGGYWTEHQRAGERPLPVGYPQGWPSGSYAQGTGVEGHHMPVHIESHVRRGRPSSALDLDWREERHREDREWMEDTPRGPSSSGTGGPEPGRSTIVKVPRKKVEVACAFCRRRKMKCDGIRPTCRNCAGHNEVCEYVPEVRRRGPGKTPKGSRAKAAGGMKKRSSEDDVGGRTRKKRQ